MNIIIPKIFLFIALVSSLCLMEPVFSQTPVPESMSEVQERGRKTTKLPLENALPFRKGHVFAAVGGGTVQHYDEMGNLLGTLNTGLGGFTTGMAANSEGDLYVTNFSLGSVSRINGPGTPHTHSLAFTTDPGGLVESIIFDKRGKIYVGQADGTRDILKFDAAGNFLKRFDVAVEDRGSDWIDLNYGQTVMYYTSEGTTVKRYDIENDIQLADFATGLPGTFAFALRLLPPSLGGGMLVADTEIIVRLDGAGNIIQTYDAPGQDTWFAINLDPDRASFWSADFANGNFYKFDIATGDILLGPINTGTGSYTLFGLAVFGEISAGRNNSPALVTKPAGPFYIKKNHLLTFDVIAYDIDPAEEIILDVIELPDGAVMDPALPALGIDSVLSTFSWIPPQNSSNRRPGLYEVTFSVRDSAGLKDTLVARIHVNETPPVCIANPAGPFTVAVNQPLTFNILATDPDEDDPITLSVLNLPPGANMVPALPLTGAGAGITSTFEWTPIPGQEDSTYLIQYQVTDEDDTSYCSVSVTVKLNEPPVCQISTPVPVVVEPGELVNFIVSASDPDPDDIITLNVAGLPAGAVMNSPLPVSGPGSGVSSMFNWTPTFLQTGNYNMTFTIVDTNGLQDTASVKIMVNPIVNNPPSCQVDPPGPFVIVAGNPLTYTVTASDPDPNNIITLNVAGLPAGAALNPSFPLTGAASGIYATFNWTPTNADVGNYVLTYIVNDDPGDRDTCTVPVTVYESGPVSNCLIFGLAGGIQTPYDSLTNTYTQEIIVSYEAAPPLGTLDVNGQSFSVVGSPQPVILTGLPADGNPVDVTAMFSANPSCGLTAPAMFTAPLGNAVGGISGKVLVDGSGLPNVTVGLFDDNNNPVSGVEPCQTDSQGQYAFHNVSVGPYQIGIVEPLGYSVDDNPKAVEVFFGQMSVVDFMLNQKVLTNDARGSGYWKHQFSFNINGNGEPQETGADLIRYIGEIHSRYTPHFGFFNGLTSLEEWLGILSVPPKSAMKVKAKKELAALLFNLVSLKIGQYSVVTEDNRTAGDVLTHVSELLTDADPINDETAKNLAESVNNRMLISAGIVSPGNILYKPGNNSGAIGGISEVPQSFVLFQNYPNPFNPVTKIRFALPEVSDVSLRIYNSAGQLVRTLAAGQFAAGYHTVIWDAQKDDGSSLASGLYIYQLKAGNFMDHKKMLLLK